MLEFDYSLVMRRDGDHDDDHDVRRLIGLFTLDWFDPEEPREVIRLAVTDTGAEAWRTSLHEVLIAEPLALVHVWSDASSRK